MKIQTTRALSLIIAIQCAPGILAISFSLPVNQNIPDGNLAGMASVMTLSGQSGSVQDLRVTLNITGTYNGDLYVYLTHGSGFSVLLNRPGRTALDDFGYGDNGLNVTFSDAATVDFHNYGDNGGAHLTGLFQPDGRQILPTEVLDTDPRTAMLSSFNGLNPNGEWVLFLADAEGGDLHKLIDWTLDFENGTGLPVPDAGNTGLLFGLALASFATKAMRRAERVAM